MVVTPGGQRLLLGHTDVTVRYDEEAKELRTSHPGWWVVNYPLEQIGGTEGGGRDEISQLLFGNPATAVKNYYVRTPGQPAPEPPAPTGPAPIRLHPEPSLVVDQGHAQSSDDANTSMAPTGA